MKYLSLTDYLMRRALQKAIKKVKRHQSLTSQQNQLLTSVHSWAQQEENK